MSRVLNTQYQKLLALMVKRVGVALRIQRINGTVRSANGPGQFMLWRSRGIDCAQFRVPYDWAWAFL